MQPYADLHLHTRVSDGSDLPETVVERAAALAFSAIAITDHDTVAGLDFARAAAQTLRITFLNGVEISASYGSIEIHIVGLGIHPEDNTLVETLSRLREAREIRIEQIITRLNELGIPLERAEVEAQAARPEITSAHTLGRIHVARALRERGITRTVQEAFDRFIRKGRKAFIPKTTISCQTAIEAIHRAGGLAFIAHPGVGNTVKSLLPRLLQLPFDGIEAYHTQHTPGHVTQFLSIAQEHGLLVTGGSDCHGTATKPYPDMGKIRLPYPYFEAIMETLEKGNHP